MLHCLGECTQPSGRKVAYIAFIVEGVPIPISSKFLVFCDFHHRPRDPFDSISQEISFRSVRNWPLPGKQRSPRLEIRRGIGPATSTSTRLYVQVTTGKFVPRMTSEWPLGRWPDQSTQGR